MKTLHDQDCSACRNVENHFKNSSLISKNIFNVTVNKHSCCFIILRWMFGEWQKPGPEVLDEFPFYRINSFHYTPHKCCGRDLIFWSSVRQSYCHVLQFYCFHLEEEPLDLRHSYFAYTSYTIMSNRSSKMKLLWQREMLLFLALFVWRTRSICDGAGVL